MGKVVKPATVPVDSERLLIECVFEEDLRDTTGDATGSVEGLGTDDGVGNVSIEPS